jgi:hypothetical protein
VVAAGAGGLQTSPLLLSPAAGGAGQFAPRAAQEAARPASPPDASKPREAAQAAQAAKPIAPGGASAFKSGSAFKRPVVRALAK